MQLQTKILLEKRSENVIDYHSNIVLFGSCFSENIAAQLNYFKFKHFQNPFGILFHPLAIENVISRAIRHEHYTDTDVFFYNEQWHCFDAHSRLSDLTKEALVKHLNTQLKVTKQHLAKATHIVITLGTAWVYKHVASQKAVANCHKVPQAHFEKTLLSVADIVEALKNISRLIRDENKDATILLTVSPVRHLKDGFVENTQSKAHLMTAVHQFLAYHNQDNACKANYFPSYEIMLDELRDYRFYQEDMVHPSALAINYIWNHFKDVWISEASYKTMSLVDTIQKGLRHKPFHPSSESHQKFLNNLEEKIDKIQRQYEHIRF
ncbi:GSCFA domain-containing protein [Tamlana fucoidanivorans]|uniref:GSCFA domain-containing protein n=1 Tax=Allotamlana fucoidanivorans TaxID=2583814 RepID=A0A5C4SGP8_9FLAO|nr:GSCFA domain-containing protein [Tamlana fucoidanivorans]TNJ42583.1 GSCFA domain-containing protein [Tamlana fucoidanivorans]